MTDKYQKQQVKSTKKKKLDFGSIKKAAELKLSQIKERS
jgi:hypothetical protein